jgi:phosphotransferase system, enzyme I, PtsP
VLEEGTPNAHVAIVARALEIPMVGSVDDALGVIQTGDPLIVDAAQGQIFVRPTEEIQQVFAENVRLRETRRALHAALRDVPAVTLDGVDVTLQINAGLLIDIEHLAESGGAGVGLYRTEVAFMIRDRFPDVDEQTELYRRILDLAGGRPVCFRTLDIGGDKLLPYWRAVRDENPAMGWRALRVALDRPLMLHEQLRALLRAAAGRELRVMFPMVSEVAELEQARAILDVEIRREERRGGQLPTQVRVGAMLEVPALAYQLPALLTRVDFVSVGSNDLLQFLFAADRGNPHLANRYDVLSPAVLAMLRTIIDHCGAASVPLTFCGEMAGQPLEAMALIGLGFRSMSMPPPLVGPIKMMTRSLRVEPLREYLQSLERLPDRSVRNRLRTYAADHNVAI